MNLVHKQYGFEVKSVDPAAHTVTAIVSTAAVDRDNEVILPQAFTASLPQFLRNGVHLWAHDASKLENILGRATAARVTPQGLLVTFKYACDSSPAARLAFDLVADGSLSAYSVGFMPVKWVVPDDKNYPALRGKARRVYTEVELWEISLCAIPSNPEALVVGRDAARRKSDLFPCPSCQRPLSLVDDVASDNPLLNPATEPDRVCVECPGCGAVMVLPEPEPATDTGEKRISIGGITLVSDRSPHRSLLPARVLEQTLRLVP